MSGVFGIVATQPVERAGAHLDAMASRLRHVPWHVTSQSVEPDCRVAMGRIGIGILNCDSQPIENDAGTLSLMMAGEVYGLRDASDLPVLPGELGDERLVLAAYEHYGTSFAEHLDGAFVVAIWDRAQQCLILANDHCGLYPTYLARLGNCLLFAPEVKALLLDSRVSRALRDDAVAEYVRFQRLLGVKTFFEGVEQMAPASVITFDLESGLLTTRTYWDFGRIVEQPAAITFDEAVEEGGMLFRSAVHKMAQGASRFGVFLSGGLDSRLILGFASEIAAPVDSFTYGTPESRDVYSAKRVARAAASPHHLHTVKDGRWILDLVDLHVDLTEGFQSWVHMHGMHMLPSVREHVEVNVSGLGDVWLLPSWHPRFLMQAQDGIAFNAVMFEFYNQHYSWPGITEAEERGLYRDAYARRLDGLAYDSFMCELGKYSHLSLPMRQSAFYVHNHFMRHLIYHGVYGRSWIEYRFPYADRDLMAFSYGLPFSEPIYNLRRAILEKEFPGLAKIPEADDELPVTTNRTREKVNKALLQSRRAISAVIPGVFTSRPKFHMDYEAWLRTDLYGWAEAILLDKRALERGIFREDALRSLLHRVRAGNQPAILGKVSHLITFELMLRQICDGQPTFE